MATEILMPRLSDSMEEGAIVKWLVEPGAEVSVGDELVEIETDKANMTYEADDAGIVHFVADEGDELPVGQPIALLLDEGEEPPSGAAGSGGAESEGSAEAQESGEGDGGEGEAAVATEERDEEAGGAEGSGGDEESGEGVEGAEDGERSRDGAPAEAVEAGEEAGRAEPAHDGDGRVKASPLAKRIAADKGVDIAALHGSGPGGRIVKKDVEQAEARGGTAGVGPESTEGTGKADPGQSRKTDGPETAKGEAEVVELTRLQKTVSRRMAESKATAPHFYLSTEVDMSRCVEARKRLKESTPEGGTVPSFNDMVVKACAIALTEFPKANGSYVDGKLELHSRVNVGVAVAAQDALVVPTVFDADRKGLVQIAEDARALAKKVRDGEISPPELSGGTFTVSNLGMYGISHFDAVINTPQAAILAVGAIEERPVVRGGEISPAHMMSVTLSCDHRILYGAEGAEFLARVKALLEEPLGLAL